MIMDYFLKNPETVRNPMNLVLADDIRREGTIAISRA